MYSTNNRSVITFTFYNCCCRCRWYCCLRLLIWHESAVEIIHRMNLIYLLNTCSLLKYRIVFFNSILFAVCMCTLRAQNVKNSEMCKWDGRMNIKHRKKRTNGMNGISYIHLCEWIQFKCTQSRSSTAAYICRPILLSNDAALNWIDKQFAKRRMEERGTVNFEDAFYNTNQVNGNHNEYRAKDRASAHESGIITSDPFKLSICYRMRGLNSDLFVLFRSTYTKIR